MSLLVDPTRTVGHSILTTGVYDIAVSEALARLIAPGDTVIDGGANVGYMTILASMAAGPSGRVLAFEPHPELFDVLRRNVAAVRAHLRIAATDLHRSALGESPGAAELHHLPPDFDWTDGMARIVPGGQTDAPSISVQVETLDDVLGAGTATVLKLDVEGFEAWVLRGARVALRERRIRHVVFEEYRIAESEAVRYLQDAGYQVYSLGWSMRGLVVRPVQTGNLSTEYEAPNFIASIAPDDMLARCQPGGWSVLSRRLVRRCTQEARPA